MYRHLLVGTIGLVLLAGCWSKSPPSPPAGGAAPATSEQLYSFTNGLNEQEREDFYHLAEGSELFPLDWLRVLQDKDTGQPVLDNIERFGLIPDPNNPDRLPIGLTAAESRGVKLAGSMVGINCAACHVGQFTYQGKSIRIDGAPNILDTRNFFKYLGDSIEDTIKEPSKLLAFLSRLKKTQGGKQGTLSRLTERGEKLIEHLAADASALKDALLPHVQSLLAKAKAAPALDVRDFVQDVKAGTDEMRARVLGDFNVANLEGVVHDADVVQSPLQVITDVGERVSSVKDALENAYVTARLLRARLEFLRKLAQVGKEDVTDWGFGRVDAFGSARTFLFDEKYQPISPVRYPHIWNFYQNEFLHYDGNTNSVLERNLGQALGVGAIVDTKTMASTLIPRNSIRLDLLAAKIKTPVWPARLFDPIDAARSARGESVFTKHCADCHPRLPDGQMARDLLFAPEKLGTEGLRAETFAAKLPDGRPFVQVLGETLKKVADRTCADNNILAPERQAWEKGRTPIWRAPGKYAGRTLAGIWAAPPYLHNGSVPTLYDLLLPADKRPTTFPIGHREYDPVNLGFRTDVPGKATYATSKKGNSNAGHEYGTDLTEDERKDLLEFLKGI